MPRSKERSAGALDRAGLASVFALTSGLATGGFLVLLPICYLTIPLVPLPPPLPPHHQTAETALYVAVFLVLLPTTVLLVPRLADRLAARYSAASVDFFAALVVGGLGGAVVLSRAADLISSGESLPVVLGLGLLWSGLVLVGLTYRPASDRLAAVARNPGARRFATVAACVLVVLGLLSLVTVRNVDLPALAVCLALAGLLVWLWGRLRVPALSGWRGLTIDLLVVLLLIVAVPDIPVYRVGELSTGALDAFSANTMQFHAALFLGASNAILHGNYLLVDTVSQYGIGSIYLIAAWFKLVPLDYGTLSLLDGVLAAVVFAMGYGILRMAGIGRAISIGAMAVTLVVLVYGLVFPIGGILQNGSIRFGLLPVGLLALRMSALRWPKMSGLTGFLGWVVVGISAIWALEGMLYVTAMLAGIVALSAASMTADRWRNWILGQVARTLVAWLVAHAAFAVVTLVASGDLPDWGLYLAYLREFLTGDVGQLTYDYDSWSPAILVGLGYLLSAILVSLIAWRKRSWLLANRRAMIAVGGLTAYGIVQYSYFANRSLGMILPFVTFPLVLLVTIWLERLLGHAEGVSVGLRRVALAVTLGLSAVAVSVAWPQARDRAPDSALAYALPGGKSLRAGLERLGNMPPLVAGADEGERLLETYMPEESSSAVIVRYDEDVNILVRANRDNSLGITDSKENSWVSGPHLPAVRRAVERLEAGDRLLVDKGAIQAFGEIRENPALADRQIIFRYRLSLIQSQALLEIGKRFDLKPVARGTDDLVVVELVPRD